MSRKSHRRRHRESRFRRRTPPGADPGTVQTQPDARPPTIHVLAYGPDEVVEEEVRDLDRLAAYRERYPVTWINVDGLGDAATIRRLGELFSLHPLAQEDVVNVHQRSKVEPYDTQLFIVARMAQWVGHVETEQLSLFLGRNWVLTFLENPGDCLDPVRDRIRKGSGRIRRAAADHLAYALLDAVIDSYFPVVEQMADRLESLEDEVGTRSSGDANARIHAIRSDLLLLRRSLRPHREAVNELVRDEHPLIGPEARLFLRDCYDHTVQLIELLEVYREMCSDLRDYHVSLASNRMNEVMKVLTIIATLFMPLSFVAGLYGMNFDTSSPWNMPELRWPFGYLFALSLMLMVAVGMICYFRLKGWIGGRRAADPDERNGDDPDAKDRGGH